MHEFDQRLAELSLVLPPAPKPVAIYVPSVRVGELVWISGQLPFVDGKLPATGLLGQDVSQDDGIACARQAALNVLAVLHAELGGDWDRLDRLIRVGVFVAATPDFTDHPKIANGASELLGHVLGEKGRHARAAVGCSSLPLGAPVEVEALAQITNS